MSRKRKPKLTIGIPTYNRPHMLPRALRAALDQSIPVRVVVADDGDPGPTREILASPEFAGRDVTHLETGAVNAWQNWRAAAEAAQTEYFAFLQDDDTIRANYAERIVHVLDYFPDANLWMARLQSGYGRGDQVLGLPYKGSCPWVPMDFMTGNPSRWLGGEILAASSYLTSWTLCPGQAFRVNDRFREALTAMPEDADMFIERLLSARVAVGGPIVVDPIVCGYWIQHPGMLSREQNSSVDEIHRQVASFLKCLDTTMDIIEARGTDWAAMVRKWLGWIPPDMLKGWVDNVAKIPESVGRGRYLDRVIGVMSEPFEHFKRIQVEAQAAAGKPAA